MFHFYLESAGVARGVSKYIKHKFTLVTYLDGGGGDGTFLFFKFYCLLGYIQQ